MAALLRTHEFGTHFDCTNLEERTFLVRGNPTSGSISFWEFDRYVGGNRGTFFAEWSVDNGNTWNTINGVLGFFQIPGIEQSDWVLGKTINPGRSDESQTWLVRDNIDIIEIHPRTTRVQRVRTIAFTDTSDIARNYMLLEDDETFTNVWDAFVANLGYSKTIISTDTPAIANRGDLWYNPTTRNLHVFTGE